MGRFAKPQVTVDLLEYQELKAYKKVVSTKVIKDVLTEMGRMIDQRGGLKQFREILAKHNLMVINNIVSDRDIEIEVVGKYERMDHEIC